MQCIKTFTDYHKTTGLFINKPNNVHMRLLTISDNFILRNEILHYFHELLLFQELNKRIN